MGVSALELKRGLEIAVDTYTLNKIQIELMSFNNVHQKWFSNRKNELKQVMV